MQTADLYDFKVTWEPFLLRVGFPADGVEKPPQYQNIDKTGHLYLAGKSVGIEFTGKCKRFPNTILGHTMLEYAKSLDPTRRIQNEAAERIFQAYFTDGQYPDRSLLDSIASDMKFDMSAYHSYMDSQENVKQAEQSALKWRSQVQTGVPFFIINGRPCFSGAQESDTFVKTFANL
ncbi:hypothetical protein EB796_015111 [Bugula neritina]|uniref:DSBA-like thioredoxin domain-containing protein n=1 Tax=Bugula neritina TaxID=10212 RepID=A0A7J7JLP4_BUGNE|nr:hypothetical protein EB796_015111 [Bugula neritina]